MKKIITAALAALALGTSLSACVPILATGAAAVTLTERRAPSVQLEDTGVESAVGSVFADYMKQKYIDTSRYTYKITSYNHKVLLNGILPSQADVDALVNLTRQQKDVQGVHNYLSVAANDRDAVDAASDTLITSAVRTALLNPTKDFSANHVKVVTYNGVCYLFGLLTPAEQKAAANYVSSVNGVKKVVTLFEPYR